MKFTCLQENLIKALTKVYRAVPTKSELPILSNILISAKDNRIKISATNLATTIVTYIGADVEEEGAITIPAKMLRDYVSNLSPSTISLSLKDDILHVKSDSTKSKFNGVTADDYPDLPEEINDVKVLELAPQTFYQLINSVAFSAAADDSKPIFTGIFLSYDGKTLTAAASDGFRLTEATMLVESESAEFKVIIPAKTLLDVSRVFADDQTNIEFGINQNDNLAVFRQNETLIATRVINGEYPDYQRIVPKETSVTANFNVAAFLEAVKLTDIFAKEADDSAILVKINPKGKIEVSASAQEAGEHKSSVEAQIESDEEVEIGFNSKYLLDFLNAIKADAIELSTSGSASPCLFKSSDDATFFHIIMPMQIHS